MSAEMTESDDRAMEDKSVDERSDVCQGNRKWIENRKSGVLCIDGRAFLIAL